jgi:hypothetical protein
MRASVTSAKADDERPAQFRIELPWRKTYTSMAAPPQLMNADLRSRGAPRSNAANSEYPAFNLSHCAL